MRPMFSGGSNQERLGSSTVQFSPVPVISKVLLCAVSQSDRGTDGNREDHQPFIPGPSSLTDVTHPALWFSSLQPIGSSL